MRVARSYCSIVVSRTTLLASYPPRVVGEILTFLVSKGTRCRRGRQQSPSGDLSAVQRSRARRLGHNLPRGCASRSNKPTEFDWHPHFVTDTHEIGTGDIRLRTDCASELPLTTSV